VKREVLRRFALVVALLPACSSSRQSAADADAGHGGTAGVGAGGNPHSAAAGSGGSSVDQLGGAAGAALGGGAGGVHAAGVGGTSGANARGGNGNAGGGATGGVPAAQGGSNVGGVSDEAGAGAGGSAGESPSRGYGEVSALSWPITDSHEFVAEADFRPPGGAGCVSEALGACELLTCPNLEQPPEAGFLGFSTASNDFAVELQPDAYRLVGIGQYFVAMEAVSINAEGGTVPSFSATISAPPALVMTDFPPGDIKLGARQISPSEDLVLTWVPVDDDLVVRAQIKDHDTNGNPLSLVCAVAIQSGGLTVPAAAFPRFQLSPVIELYTLRTTMISAGDYDLMLSIGTTVNDPDGNLVVFQPIVTLPGN